jgi:acyl carrier protein
MDTTDKVVEFIQEELLFGNKDVTIDPDDSLFTRGILDSLSLLRLIAFLEEQLGIEVKDVEVTPDNFQTINEINAFIQRKKAGN